MQEKSQYQCKEIKEGIKIHTIRNSKFKTNLVAVFLTTKLSKENVTKNALISAILRRGSKKLKTQEEISKKLEEMYGASFNCGIDKTGDNHILKFYLESVNDNFLPQNDENMLKTSIEELVEIVLNPLTSEEGFNEKYLKQEKENIKKRIEGKIDNKAQYSFERCIEEMYKNKPYGLYKFGYIEDLEKISNKELYNYYKELIQTCKVDIFISGNISEEDNIFSEIENNENIKKLIARKPNYNIESFEDQNSEGAKTIKESMGVTQGKLVIGLDISKENKKEKYKILIYNAILGGTANSKLFQEVREKASLAYTASSSYLRHKGNIIIICGIEIQNFDKALEIIKKQLENMQSGNFSDEDIQNAKKGITSSIMAIEDEQDSEIMYYFGQELTNKAETIEEYIKNIQNVTKEDIQKIAKDIKIDTIYFLKD